MRTSNAALVKALNHSVIRPGAFNDDDQVFEGVPSRSRRASEAAMASDQSMFISRCKPRPPLPRYSGGRVMSRYKGSLPARTSGELRSRPPSLARVACEVP